MTARALLAPVLAGCVLLGACDVSFDVGHTAPVSPRTVPGPDLATLVTKELTAWKGQAPPPVTCPEVAARAGALVRCAMDDGESRLGITVTLTEVDDDGYRASIVVDDAATRSR